MTTPNGSGLSTAVVDISTAGSNVVVSSTSSGIFIRRVILALASQTTVQFMAGSRELTGPMPLTKLGLGFSDQAYYVCDPGEDFIIVLGDAVETGGAIWYQRGPL